MHIVTRANNGTKAWRGRLLSRAILSVGDATLLHELLRYRTANRTFPETRLIQLRAAVEIAAHDNRIRPPRFPSDQISNDGISRIRRRIDFANCSLLIVP